MPMQPSFRDNAALQKYYGSFESRLGYWIFLGDTRHFGLYDSADSSPFSVNHALRRMEKRLYDTLGLGQDAEVLDAGCGVGHVAIYLANRGLRIHGIDLVESHIRKARRNVHNEGLDDRIELNLQDYHDLTLFEDKKFDGVYTMETFVHATDPIVALKEFHRVLKPGGKLAMYEYDHAPSESLPADVLNRMKEVNRYSAMPANQSFEPGVLERLLEDAGFTDIHIEDISTKIMPMLWLFYIIAIVPYLIIRFLRLQSHFVNTMAGAEGYRAMKNRWTRYVVISATKPTTATDLVEGLTKRP
jgi:sterol 24-C-methyltransferase